MYTENPYFVQCSVWPLPSGLTAADSSWCQKAQVCVCEWVSEWSISTPFMLTDSSWKDGKRNNDQKQDFVTATKASLCNLTQLNYFALFAAIVTLLLHFVTALKGKQCTTAQIFFINIANVQHLKHMLNWQLGLFYRKRIIVNGSTKIALLTESVNNNFENFANAWLSDNGGNIVLG